MFNEVILAKDLPSKWDYVDHAADKADAKVATEAAYDRAVREWMQGRPEVGVLNRKGNNVFYTNFPYTEIAVFSK